MARENKSKMPNGFYKMADTLFAVTFQGAQAIRMTDGKIFEPAPAEFLTVAQIHADFTLRGCFVLKPGYGIAWDLNDGADDWCVVGSLK